MPVMSRPTSTVLPTTYHTASARGHVFPLISFITDGTPESVLWETNYLVQPEVVRLLKPRAILLRIEATSLDAYVLKEAYKQEQRFPQLLVVTGGKLYSKITAGPSRNEFIEQLTGILWRLLPPPPYMLQSPPMPDIRLGPSPLHGRFYVPSAQSSGSVSVLTQMEGAGQNDGSRPRRAERPQQRQLSEIKEWKGIVRLVEITRMIRGNHEGEGREGNQTQLGGAPQNGNSAESSTSSSSDTEWMRIAFRSVDRQRVLSIVPSSMLSRIGYSGWVLMTKSELVSPYDFSEIRVPSKNSYIKVAGELLELSSLFELSPAYLLDPNLCSMLRTGQRQ